MYYKIGVISLGCAKNTVDTEIMLGEIQNSGHFFVQSLAQADIALINTCGFITEAKEEAISAILEAERQKRFGNLKAIIVTGCLSERYKHELKNLFPRVDAFLGVGAHNKIVKTINEVMSGKNVVDFTKSKAVEGFNNRIITTYKPTAYVKISEGCDNKCSYCAIPYIRGKYTSRDIDSILTEITELAKRGYSEIILVAQDTTKYGIDLYGKPQLRMLLEKAAQIHGIRLLRVLYFYPDENLITEELLRTMAVHENIANYIDMPVQHLDDSILKAMNRNHSFCTIMKILDRIRNVSQDFIIRSTVMVGFPGETEKKFKTLINRLKETNFNNLGAFAYSQEEGTPAFQLGNQLGEEVKVLRKNEILSKQSLLSLISNEKFIGRTIETLIEKYDSDKKLYVGRSYAHIPDVDGTVLIKSDVKLDIGNYYPVKIKRAYNYDLEGELQLKA